MYPILEVHSKNQGAGRGDNSEKWKREKDVKEGYCLGTVYITSDRPVDTSAI